MCKALRHLVACIFGIVFITAVGNVAFGAPNVDLSEAISHNSEVVLDGTMDFSDKGVLLYTSPDSCVVLEGIDNVGLPGQHIMVVGYPYKKESGYYLSVTGYTFL